MNPIKYHSNIHVLSEKSPKTASVPWVARGYSLGLELVGLHLTFMDT